MAILIDQAHAGEYTNTIPVLESVVREFGSDLSDDDLYRLAALSRSCPPATTDTVIAFWKLVRDEMVRRGVWRSFRIRELLGLASSALKWGVAMIAMSVALLVTVFSAVTVIKWVGTWMGF